MTRADVTAVRKAAIANVMLEWAWNPYRTAQEHTYLFNTVPDPVTYQTVEEALGKDAAEAWQAIREAKRTFLKAAGLAT